MLWTTSSFLLLFLPLCCTHLKDDSKETLQRLAQLYDNLRLDGKELTERYLLMGLLSDAINTGKMPGEERTLRDMEVVERGDEFEARVLTQSLAASFEYIAVRGTVDYAKCEILLSSVVELDLSHYAGKRFGGSSALTRGLKDVDGVRVNNGSKGEASSVSCTCIVHV